MSTATLPAVDSLIDDLKTADADAQAAYRGLVIQLAEGDSTDPQQVRSILADCDRTTDDLQRHVALAASRRQAVDDLKEADRLEGNRPAIKSEMEAAAEKVADLKREQQTALQPLAADLDATIDAMKELKRTVRDLRRQANPILQRTQSEDFRTRFMELSNADCQCSIALHDAKRELPRYQKRLSETFDIIGRWQGELRRIERKPANETAKENFQGHLVEAEAEKTRLENKIAEVETLKKERTESAAKLKQFRLDNENVWQNFQLD